MTQEELLMELTEAGLLRNPKIADAFKCVDRADFVPRELAEEAYENIALPIGYGQTISQPLTVAVMLNLLNAQYGENILDVGSGSGWQATLLGYLVSMPFDEHKSSKAPGHITSLELIPELADQCQENISKYGFTQDIVETQCTNAKYGFPDNVPYDKIIAAAELDEIPIAWRNQLKDGGVIVAPIHNSVVKLTKKSVSKFDEETYPGFVFVPFIK